jgi:hypothetical protein
VDQAAEPIPAQDPDVRAQGGLIAPAGGSCCSARCGR